MLVPARVPPAIATAVDDAGFRTLLNGGILALLGMVMVLPMFVPFRWRRRRRSYDDDFGYSDPADPAGLLG